MNQRLIVPDLARGLALLGIAMANISTAWIIADMPGATGEYVGWVQPGNVADQIAAMFAAMFVHVRGLPMFSTLLGFGVGLITMSLSRKNYPVKKARLVLVKRYGILALFGLVHMFFIFNGDIMVSYGLCGMVLGLLIAVRTKILRIIAYCFIGFSIFMAFLGAVGAAFGQDLMLPLETTDNFTTPAEYFIDNATWGFIMLINAVMANGFLLGVMLIGFIWAREGVLADVNAHRRTLIIWSALTVAVILLIGIPLGLASIGVFSGRVEAIFIALNQGFGMITGPGILAMLALATQRLHNKVPVVFYPFVALGKRSMSGYIMQSILFIVTVMPFGLGLGLESGVAIKLLIATGIWAVTLILATILEATNTPGPFEWAHRHLSYGKTGRLEPYTVAHA
ncbi:DUF418 domain-containing protein [Corynebacterium tuscaniense]|uniref:DUF418 domain-containing protein n=1 Tax=Corynebacterium tuscaniense TaxID=302449 RepID=UPI001E31432F|nr:DUF418 domain-containing protein [Corynebacterium tuscaniense]